MWSSILLIVCVIVTGFIGWNLLYLLSGQRFGGFYLLERFGLSCLFGFGLISVQMFIMGLFGIGFTRLTILLPWVAIIGIIHACRFANMEKWRRFFCERTSLKTVTNFSTLTRQFHLTFVSVVLAILIVAQTCYNFFRALIKPIESYDAVAIYGLKSKVICLAGGISGDFFKDIATNFHGIHPDYPLLIPLSEVWVYTFLANFNDLFVKAIFPLFYLSFLFIFYAAIQRTTQNKTLSLFFTFALASIKQFSDYSTIAVADLTVGIYFSIAIFYLYLWFKARGERHFLNISLVASVLCLWTKNEGVLLVLMLLFVFFLYTIANKKSRERKEVVRSFFVYAFVIIFAIFSWVAFKAHNGLVNENFNVAMLNFHKFITNISRLPIIAYEYQKQLFGFKKWNIIWILFIFLLFKELKAAFSGDIKYVTFIFPLFLLGYTFVYIFSDVEIDFFLRKTFSRFLLHVLPTVVFWMALVFGKKKYELPFRSR